VILDHEDFTHSHVPGDLGLTGSPLVSLPPLPHLFQSLLPPYGVGQAIIFLPCGFFLLSFFFSPNLSSRRLDVYHTSTHGVALVQI